MKHTDIIQAIYNNEEVNALYWGDLLLFQREEDEEVYPFGYIAGRFSEENAGLTAVIGNGGQDIEIPIADDGSFKYIFENQPKYAYRYSNLIKVKENSQTPISLDVKHYDVSAITNMGSMFYYCTALQSLDIGGWDVSSVTRMDNMFRHCIALKSLDLGGWDVSNVTKMDYMFYDCETLQSLDLSGLDVSNVTDMSGMFGYCYALTTVTGPIYGIQLDLDLHHSPLSNSSAMVFIDGLAEVETSQTITFKTETYDTLTEEQIAIATSKGWDVVRG